MSRLAIVVAVTAAIAGCALQHVKLYDGPDRAPSEHSALSSIANYPDRQLSLRVVEVDGKSITHGRAASYLLLPGSYAVKVLATKDARFGAGQMTYKRADPVSRLEAKAGHTYIPNAVIRGDMISVYFEDKGLDFPRECLPLYVAVNESSNPGAMVYRSDKTCDR